MKKSQKLDIIRQAHQIDTYFTNEFIIDEGDAYSIGLEWAYKHLKGAKLKEAYKKAREIVDSELKEEVKAE